MKHKYTVTVRTSDLTGFFEYVELLLDEKIDVDDLDQFFDDQNVSAIGDNLAYEEQQEREEAADSQDEIDDMEDSLWYVSEIRYEGEVE